MTWGAHVEVCGNQVENLQNAFVSDSVRQASFPLLSCACKVVAHGTFAESSGNIRNS